MKKTASPKKWTVMVYLAGDNNLDANGITDIAEMKKVGSSADLNIIAQFDREGAGKPTKRYYLRKGTTLTADEVQSLGETNTGQPGFLLDFIKWGANQYPADHYMLILWNHGQGWDDTDIFAGERVRGSRLLRSGRIRYAFFKSTVLLAARLSTGNQKTARAILIDDDARDFLDSLEMKKVLMDAKTYLGRKIDIVGMDACLMSMAEVCYQMRNSVRYLIASEETEPLDGWPYDSILEQLAANTDSTPGNLSKIVVKKYIESYKYTGESVTQAACDLMKSEQFAGALKALSAALIAGLADTRIQNIIMNARNRVQEYMVTDNVDLINLCQSLKKAGAPKAIADACDRVTGVVKKSPGFVISSGYSGSSMKNSNGIAIYFPARELSPLYARLDFPKKTGWGRFLKEYLAVSGK